MKRLALLLAAMGIVSVGVMAEEPALKVTNFGQSIEVENVSGNSNIGETWFWNNLGMKYDDWTFSLQFGKQWDLDTDKGVVGIDDTSFYIDKNGQKKLIKSLFREGKEKIENLGYHIGSAFEGKLKIKEKTN